MATSTVKQGSKSTKKTETKSAGSKRASAAKPSKATPATSSSASRTTDHDQIRKWAEQRKGKPAVVKQTGKGNSVGILRIDFPGYSGKDTLETIEWDAFFRKFDESNLEFLYQEKTASGKASRFNKFVSKES